MTSIEKLLIQGIRSFDPKDGSVIDFYTPLTLLVGSNGAGKTTVIECLKYISTGEMPPNCSSGQAFIHDTRIANENEVKAQIKLRFKNPNGKPIVATRSLSLIQKANKQEYRQIDSSLQSYNSDGQKVSKSFRCSDLDKEIPELMGVAKPILRHVIFCHQEESNWPLSESSKLKIKFDEIFAAVRYTKALKSIKDKRKELAAQIKEYKLKLEVVSSNKDHAHRIKQDHLRMETQLVKDNETLEKLRSELIDKRRDIERIDQLNDKLNTIQSESSVLEARIREMDRQKQQYLSTVGEVMTETDQELLAMSSSFEEEINSMKSAEKELSENSNRLVKEKQQFQNKLLQYQNELIKHQVAKEQYTQLSRDRDREIVEFVNRYKMKGYSFTTQPLQEGQTIAKEEVERFIKEISDKFKLLSSALSDSQNNNPATNIQATISDLTLSKQKLEASTHQSSQHLSQNQNKIKSLEEEISGYYNSSIKLKELENEIKTLDDLSNQLEREIQQGDFVQTIQKLQESKKSSHSELLSLNENLKSLMQLNVKINSKSLNLQDIVKKLNDKLNFIKPQLDSIFSIDQEYNNDNLNQLIKEKLNLKQTELNGLVNNNQKNCKEVVLKYKNEISFIQKDINQVKMGLKNINVKEMEKINSIEELDQKLKDMNEKLDQSKKSCITLESEEIVYKEYIEKANINRECSLCKTEMKTEQDLNQFIDHLSEHCENIPSNLVNLRKEITNLTSSIEHLSNQRKEFEKYSNIMSHLENSNKQIKEKTEELTNTDIIDREQMVLIEKLKVEVQVLQEVQISSRVIGELNQDRKKLENEIKEEQIKIQPMGDVKVLEERIQELNSKFQSDSEEIDRVSSISKEKNDSLYKVKSKLMGYQSQVSMISNSSGIIERLKESKQELLKEITNLEITIQSNQISIQQLNENIKVTKEKFDSEKEKFENKLSTLQKEKNLFSTRLESIRNYHSKTSQYVGDDQFNSISNQIQSITNSITMIDNDYSVGEASLLEIRNGLSQTDFTKRMIADNISYRQHLSNIEQLTKQYERKQEVIRSIGSTDEIRNLQESKKHVEQLKSKFDLITGQTNITTSQITQLQKELTKPIYNAVDENYKDLFLKMTAADIVYHDLDKYYKALDKSLMKYHTIKMDEINKSIREIWQTTYKGNDIDTIEIRSEETKTANKTVNYRVVMVKGDVEMDMRGRCSAGQKVLACLVIRMALAENFCSNCGILALDEPTSHLDRSNIESFANSLLNIIESRKNQKGFQLIIITHDEEFVQYLSRGNFCDYYWRVKKNAQQHSTLERKSISDL